MATIRSAESHKNCNTTTLAYSRQVTSLAPLPYLHQTGTANETMERGGVGGRGLMGGHPVCLEKFSSIHFIRNVISALVFHLRTDPETTTKL